MMAYVNRRRGIGQTQYQGPCADPSQTMDPITGLCVSSSDLLQQIINSISSLPGGATTSSTSVNSTMMIALVVIGGIALFGALKK